MQNPYTPPTPIPDNESRSVSGWSPFVLLAVITIAICAFITLNYATATAISISTYSSFKHVVFLLTPISTAVLLNYLINRKATESTRRATAFLVPTIGIPLAFAISWLPSFTSNPYERFALMNLYFGPYGWMQWFWLVATGILPAATFRPSIRNSRSALVAILCMVAVAQIHNAYWVWTLCHSRP